MTTTISRQTVFDYDPGEFWDEMFVSPREVRPVRWLAVLRSAGSAEAYSRYYSLRVEPTRVIEFLLLNALFPQSVRYSLGVAWDALQSISSATMAGSGRPVRLLGMLRARLGHASV